MKKRRGRTVAERMAASLRREEAEATGKPLYVSYADVPPGLCSKTACMKLKRPAADMDTLTIAALLHDVCKIHLYEKTEDGYRHNEQFPIGHGEKSVVLILRHMPLTDEEITAISWHMGAFDSRAGAGRSLSQAWEKCPLALHLHLADMEATWFDEKREPQK